MTQVTPINEWFGRQTELKKKLQATEKRKKGAGVAKKIEYRDPESHQISEDEEWFRHFNWREKRIRVRQALVDAGTGQNAMTAFDNCGSDCQVEYSETEGRYRVMACYCHNRHCEPCMKAKSALITNNLRTILKSRPDARFRFITLTLKHSDAPLRQQIKRLYSCYKELRRDKDWKTSQKGGAATLEIKWNPLAKKWHPHLHIISEGDYLSTYALSNTWKRITGDSHVVDIRLISKDKDVAYYVGKYVTKGTNAEVWDDPAVAKEWVQAVKGVRMCATFGNWRGIKLLNKEKEVPGTWKHIASLASLVRRANAGEVAATQLLIVLTETQQYNPNRKRPPKPRATRDGT
jgi:hypothetical protein